MPIENYNRLLKLTDPGTNVPDKLLHGELSFSGTKSKDGIVKTDINFNTDIFKEYKIKFLITDEKFAPSFFI